MNKIFLTILFAYLFTVHSQSASQCECPTSAEPPQDIPTDYTEKDVIINGVHYGHIFQAVNMVFLSRDIVFERTTSNSLQDPCPTGYRLPTKEEYESLLTNLGTKADSVFLSTSDFNLQTGYYYMTSTKVYPDNTDGSTNEAWMFYGLSKSGSTYQVASVTTYWQQGKMFAKCIQPQADTSGEGESGEPQIPDEDVIIDGVNYGKSYSAGNYVFLNTEFNMAIQCYSVTDPCPTGYRLPTRVEYNTMISNMGGNAGTVLSDTNGFNFKSGYSYLTSDSASDGSGLGSFMFYGLKKSGIAYQVVAVTTLMESGSMIGKCIDIARIPTKAAEADTSGNYIVDGVNYGKPFTIGGLTFLPTDVGIERTSKVKLNDPCPSGYRLPTKLEYEGLITSLGSDISTVLTNADEFNFQTGYYYLTNEKINPSNTDGSTNEAWMFYSLQKSGSTFKVASVNTYFKSAYLLGKCVQDTSSRRRLTTTFSTIPLTFPVEGIDNDLIVNEARTLTIDSSAVVGFLWRFNSQVYTQNTASITNTQRGCNLLEIWGKTLTGVVGYQCKVIYTRPKMGNNNSAAFSLNKVTTLSHEFSTDQHERIHFTRGHAPIAPKTNGGYYMAYTDKTTNYLHVVEFDSLDNIVNDETLEYQAFPLDIIETDAGFGIYCRHYSDTGYTFVVQYRADYTKITETTVIHYHGTDSLVFYDSNGEPLFGVNQMYNGHNGKLAYGRGKLNLIFAHYNNFTTSGGHTGDSYYSFDLTGSQTTARYAWAWETSHSLIQSHLYNGKYFLTAALGDSYPMGIQLSIIDMDKGASRLDKTRGTKPNYSYVTNDSMFDIKGSQSGYTMGRLGGIMDFDSFYAVVYSIKHTTDNANEGIFLTTFSYTGTAINEDATYNLVTTDITKLKSIRAVKYGNSVLISYVLSTYDYGTGYPSDEIYCNNNTETMYYLLVGTDGTIKTGPLTASTLQIALSEDLRELKDGSLRWGYVDNQDVLRIVKVAAP